MIKVANVPAGCMLTYSGKIIDYLNTDPKQIINEDIGMGLMNMCRWNGQVSQNFSILKHSFLVAKLAPKELYNAGLLHDVPEYILGDVATPLKNILGEVYLSMERNIQRIIGKKYGVTQAEFEAVAQYDMLALRIEEHYLRNPYVLGINPQPYGIEHLESQKIERIFKKILYSSNEKLYRDFVDILYRLEFELVSC